MIRTSKHSTKFSNTRKKDDLALFINEYRRVAGELIDFIWDNGIEWSITNKETGEETKNRFSIKDNLLELPKYLPTNVITGAGIETFLSGRALKCLITQVRGILSSSVEKQRKRLYALDKSKKGGTPRRQRRLLAKKIKTNIPQKPNSQSIRPELNSICVEFIDGEFSFDGFVRLKSITKTKMEILIPYNHHRHSRKLRVQLNGTRKNSICLGIKDFDLRWEIEKKEIKKDGRAVGADQGLKTTITLSDKQETPRECPHGHSLDDILDKLSRKKKGSKAFKRAQDHRDNHINWSINQLNFSDIKELRIEKIWNIGYKNKTNRKMSHWTNTLIRDKVLNCCEMNGVHVIQQASEYRSQRCSSCGSVRKANRKGKDYQCKRCGFTCDADLNASLNHEIDLPEIPWTLRGQGHNKGEGFLWNPDGIFDLDGRSLESLPPAKP